MIERFGSMRGSSVVEIASNDGYLLRNFVARGIPVLGIEPAANVADVAMRQGVPTRVAFFGEALARDRSRPRTGRRTSLRQQCAGPGAGSERLRRRHAAAAQAGGVITIEFPHLLRLMRENQFDTIYHEHFSYFSFITAESDLRALTACASSTSRSFRPMAARCECTPATRRRLEAGHRARQRRCESAKIDEGLDSHRAVPRLRRAGERNEMEDAQVSHRRQRSREVDRRLRRSGQRQHAAELLRHSHRFPRLHGRPESVQARQVHAGHADSDFRPGKILETKPDYVLILPWNFKDEIMKQWPYIREWGGKFVVPIPEVRVV